MKPEAIIYRFALGGVIVSMLLLCLLAVAILWGSGRREIINCSKFGSLKEAQNTFFSNPKKYQVLDRNKDGKICSDYFK